MKELRMLLSRSLLSCALSIATSTCWACRVPLPEQLITPDVQVALATDAVLARVVNIIPKYDKGGDVDYQFLVVQRLTGSDQELFSISGHAPGRSRETTFDKHQDEAFWRRGGGRVMNDVDCVIHPEFVLGKTYLVFRNLPMTRRSFEEIDTANGHSPDDDQWFAYIQAYVRQNRSNPPRL